MDAKDANGKEFIRDLVEKAVPLKPGEVTEEIYAWKNPGDNEARTKIVRATYFAPWDWVVGASS